MKDNKGNRHLEGAMREATLFELPEPQEPAPTPPTPRDEARVLRPDRQQLQWLPRDLDEVLAQDGMRVRAPP